MSAPVPTARSAAAIQTELISVKANCKKAYDWLRIRDRQMGQVIGLIEGHVLENPDDDEAKVLLLSTYETYDRKKTVVSYEAAKTHRHETTGEVVYDKTASGEQIWVKMGHEESIDTTSWEVSIVKKGTAVRIHLTAEMADEFESDWAKRIKNEPHKFRNAVVYR
jgi:hypothetical protein